MPSQQLPLALQHDDEARFEGFYAGEGNAAALDLLMCGHEPVLYLFGLPGVGKSHLLQASVNAAAGRGEEGCYLPLRELRCYPPAEVLAGLEHMAVLALDDIHEVAGCAEWEAELFHLFNRLRAEGGRWLASASSAISDLQISLADLRSRLAWGTVLQLRPLREEEKLDALRQRAHRQGLELPEETALFLLNRCGRDMHTLLKTLARLERASLARKRRLSLPFAREILATRE